MMIKEYDMNDNLIKSPDRVKDHGEVFTPKRIVNLMLDQPEIQAKINDLTATFFEPSAGEGAFLVELLKRKLKVARDKSTSASTFNTKSLLALSTLYGIELLEDNVEMLVMNMITTFNLEYSHIITTDFRAKVNRHVLDSAKVIIQANMVQGNTLEKVSADGSPIIFSEWKPEAGNNVQRTEYTFEAIIDQSGPTGTVQGATEEMDLFADTGYFDDSKKEESKMKQYALCSWASIYKQKIA
ncbi:MAG TPA: N-6 DNA methylase [Lactobacillus crispatus]|uniref:N-6 DNA methylase n=1 Tax=Lactobacillus crispatus TaxID=47770 RepID=A0A921K687_9LACO|nr:N-6 DNA methylase [Lactobacillus crispatus]